jgi:hypothetical protein
MIFDDFFFFCISHFNIFFISGHILFSHIVAPYKNNPTKNGGHIGVKPLQKLHMSMTHCAAGYDGCPARPLCGPRRVFRNINPSPLVLPNPVKAEWPACTQAYVA